MGVVHGLWWKGKGEEGSQSHLSWVWPIHLGILNRPVKLGRDPVSRVESE